jgi:hypothetical protein
MYLSSTVDELVCSLRPAFSREASFRLFYLVVFAMSVMIEPATVTAIVRVFNLVPELCYHRLLHLFRSKAVHVDRLGSLLLEYLLRAAPVKRIGPRPVFAVDSIKAPKEGRRMPGVKRQHQESGDNAKSPYVFAHLFGALSVLCQTPLARFALLLRMCLQDGFKTAATEADEPSQVDKMASLIVSTVRENAYILADSFYAAQSFMALLLHHGHHLITRVRSTTVAHKKPPPQNRKTRGRPRTVGEKLKLKAVFDSPERFRETIVDLAGTPTRLSYCFEVLLWHGQEVLFVFSKLHDNCRAIYLCTDTTLEPRLVIELYAGRFGIEHAFKHLVHTVSAFAYRFWTKVLERKQRLQGSLSLSELDERTRRLLTDTVQAYHVFVAASCVALTSLQLIALKTPELVQSHCPLYFRTPTRSGSTPSEQMARYALQLELSRFSTGSRPPLLLWEILPQLQRPEPTRHPLEVLGCVT